MATRKIDSALLNDTILWQCEDFISIQFLVFDQPLIKTDQLIVFTSKNAVEALFAQYPDTNLNTCKVVCVGAQTRNTLLDRGITVLHADFSSKQLGEWVVQHENDKEIVLFCGNLRRTELKDIAHKNKIKYTEIIVYKTVLTPVEVDVDPDGIVFLSPSAIQSFNMKNKMPNAVAFCIGNTTAMEAKKHFVSVEMSEELSIKSVIEKVHEYYGIK